MRLLYFLINFLTQLLYFIAILLGGLILTIVLFFVGLYLHDKYQQKKGHGTFILGLAGDCMIGRMVNELLKTKSPNYPWGNMLDTIKSVDFSIINLETTLTTSSHIVSKVFNFKSDPKNVAVLQKAGITVVNLANNHILDFGEEGLNETIATLWKSSTHYVGAGMDIYQARKPFIFVTEGFRIGVIGCTDNEPDWLATNDKPGINYIKIGDLQTISKQIDDLRPKVDLLILSIHWGPNMRKRPSGEFQKFAHALIDAGVDILHGHSAHIVQGIELYNNRLILYDTGDFVNDYAVDPQLRNDQSLFFKVTVKKDRSNIHLSQLTVIPVRISNMQVNKAEDMQAKQFLEHVQTLSREFGTVIDDHGTVYFQ